MADRLLPRVARDAGGEHWNVSTPAPVQQQGGDTTSGSSSGTPTAYIVTGVVVPLVLIGIGALLFYIWYRKKYPVRMVIGKDFEKFTNPAYSKRNSTLTLVREDAEHYWDTFQPSGIQNPGLSLVNEEVDDITHGDPDARDEVEDEMDATVKIEHIERMIAASGNDIEEAEVKSNDSDVNSQLGEEGSSELELESNDKAESDMHTGSSVKPRKAMLIEEQNFEGLDSGFEIVTEDDINEPLESERSSLNDSTDTHTIILTTAETTEASSSSDSSSQENAEESKLAKESTSQAQFHNQMKDDVSERAVSNEEIEDINSNDQDITNESTENENLLENGILSGTEEEVLLENTNHVQNLNLTKDENNAQFDTDDLNKTLSVSKSDIANAHIEGFHSSESDNSLENINFESESARNMTKLTLSTENIYLEEVPTTPTVVIQDSIIFEAESTSPVHLDNVPERQETSGRQRRAHTIECVYDTLKKANCNENTVTKEWYSFDDIDKMSGSKSNLELFEPIRKPLSKSDSSDNDESLSDPEIKHPMPKPSDTDLDVRHDEALMTHNDQLPSVEPSDSHGETLQAQAENTLTSHGSFSFEVLNESSFFLEQDEENSSDHSDISDRHSSINNQLGFKIMNEENQSASSTLGQTDVGQSILPASTDSAVLGLILDQPDTKDDFPILSNPSIEILENNNSEVDISLYPLQHKSEQDLTGMMKGLANEDFVNVIPNEATGSPMGIAPLSQESVTSDLITPLIDDQDRNTNSEIDNFNTNVTFESESKSVGSDDENLLNSSVTDSQSDAFDFMIDIQPDTKVVPVSQNTCSIDESFKQFQTSFVQASTPNASLVIDPLVSLNDSSQLDFDNDEQKTSTGTSDPFKEADTHEDMVIQGSSTQITSNESSSVHSWEFVSEDDEKNISRSSDGDNSLVMANASIVTLDQEIGDSDTSSQATTDFLNVQTGEISHKTKITPKGILFDFFDTPQSDDKDDGSDGGKDDSEDDIQPASISNPASSGDGNLSWEVLEEDTDA